jgi:hypothetical protein
MRITEDFSFYTPYPNLQIIIAELTHPQPPTKPNVVSNASGLGAWSRQQAASSSRLGLMIRCKVVNELRTPEFLILM